MRTSHRMIHLWRRNAVTGAIAAGCLVALCAAAQADITVNFGSYTGLFRVSGPAGYSQSGVGSTAGANLGTLADGEYFFDNGSSLGNAIAASYFTFTVSNNQITAVSNPAAASIGGGGESLLLSNSSISVDPGSYSGPYWLSSYSAGGARWQGQQTFVLIPGLLYAVDNTSLIGYSAFSFVVDGSGNIADVLDANGSPTSVPATASGSTLALQNVLVQVDPTTYAGSYRVGGVDVTAGGKTTITLIPGLLTSIGAGGSGVGNFTPLSGMPQTTVTNGSLTFLVGPPTPPDTTPPTTTVTISPDPSTTAGTGGWDNSSVGTVSVSLSAVDESGGSGVKSVEYSTDGGASWNAYTTPLTYSADGIYTVLYRATDNAGNVEKNPDGSYKSVTIKIDKTPPAVAISTPFAGAAYLLNQPVTASYSMTDAGSGVDASHSGGTVSNGSLIDTASAGSKSFTVKAQDIAGNTATQTVSYTVGYGVALLYDPTKYAKSGSTIPIKLQLVDYKGADVSSSSIIVTAVSVTLTGNATSTVPADAGNANPDNNFRYDASLAGYIYNLSTAGLTAGTYTLSFTVGGDPTSHTVQFQVR